MTVKEAIEKLTAIAAEKGEDAEISLVEVSGDRYGSTVGLVVGNDNENPIISKYFGGEMPLW